MSHNTASTASILQIRPGLDRWDFKLDYDIIKVHFSSLLIKLFTHKPTASFWKSTKIGPKSHSDSISKLWQSRTWFLRFCNQNRFKFRIRRDWNRTFLPRNLQFSNFGKWNPYYSWLQISKNFQVWFVGYSANIFRGRIEYELINFAILCTFTYFAKIVKALIKSRNLNISWK